MISARPCPKYRTKYFVIPEKSILFIFTFSVNLFIYSKHQRNRIDFLLFILIIRLDYQEFQCLEFLAHILTVCIFLGDIDVCYESLIFEKKIHLGIELKV